MLEEVDLIEIIVLADAYADITLPGGHCVERLPLGDAPCILAAWFLEERTVDWPTAEPGFSAFIDLIVLSHGHFDHTAGMERLVTSIGRASLPVIIHPDFWLQRRLTLPGRDPVELPTPSRRAFLDAGLDVLESRVPSVVLENAVLITGEIERSATAEAVRAAQELTGVHSLHAVFGGFHLNGPLFAPRITETVDVLRESQPEVVVAAPCSGPQAHRALAEAFPGAYSMSSVGTRIALGGEQQ